MKHIDQLIERLPALAGCKEAIVAATEAILTMHQNGGKLMICGNGGSAADGEHIAGELLKGFLLKRTPEGDERDRLMAALGSADVADQLQQGVAAVPLSSLSAVFSAFCNDVDPALVYAQLAYAMGKPNDVLLCISTSGNSANVVNAAKVARAQGIRTVALTGGTGGKLAALCDIAIVAPESETYLVQECHLPIYHAICAQVEETLFGK